MRPPAEDLGLAGRSAGRAAARALSPSLRRLSAIAAAAAVGAVLCIACRRPSEASIELVVEGTAFGTTWRVRTAPPYPDATPSAEAIHAQVMAELERLDRIFSHWRDDSVVAAFNSHASVAPFAVPDELAAVVVAALAVGEESGGAYDVTVLPVVEQFGFAPLSGAPVAGPSAPVDFRLLRVDRSADGARLSKNAPELRIDLSSIAKGYAVDRISTLLQRLGFSNHLVEIGGEIRAEGASAEVDGWVIGIETPAAGEGAVDIAGTIRLANAAVATSGSGRQGFAVDGRRFSHLIDPRTRSAEVPDGMGSVTVRHPSAMWADAYATAVFVLGRDDGIRFCGAHGVAALILAPDGSILHDTIGVRRPD